jgi:hypothetical protein
MTAFRWWQLRPGGRFSHEDAERADTERLVGRVDVLAC